MALPSSGEIKASQINTEAGRSSNAEAPLSGDSSTPQAGSLVKLYEGAGVNQAAPHSYSEFYGKSFNLTAFQSSSFSLGTNDTVMCNSLYGSTTYTRYHNGSGTLPSVGDTVYYDDLTPINYSVNAATLVVDDFLIKFNANSPVVQSIYDCGFCNNC
jgi:hypothetical protein